MSSENKMEVDNPPQATEEAMSIGDNDNEASNQDDKNMNKEESDVVILSSAPNTPTPSEAKLKSNKSKSNLSSAEKLKRQELAQKRQEEKEKKEKEKKLKEEQRIKREEELKRKKEEEAKKQEELRIKREEEKQKKEEERKKMEAEKERKKQEQLEKERKRQELLNAKIEEKRKKDEERQKLEEEKLKEEEEKRRKADKIKNQFVGYFIKKENTNKNDKEEQKMYRFMSFQLKENMTIAPIHRRKDFLNMTLDERHEFFRNIDDLFFKESDASTEEKPTENAPNYLEEIRKNSNLIRKNETKCRRKNIEEDSCDVKEIIDINTVVAQQTRFKVKYLHFDQKAHRRPPYYGTWRKKSKVVNPRKPFAKDGKHIDYDINSDDEWEDEPEGESIADSEKEDEDDIVDDEDDDGFFVPHGHLSDDELDEEDRLLDPETKKARENCKNEEYERERQKKSKVLIPKWYIAYKYWDSPEEDERNNPLELRLLERFKMVPLAVTLPVTIKPDVVAAEPKNHTNEESTPKAKKTNNNLGAANEASPQSANKTNKSKQKRNSMVQQSPLSTPSGPVAVVSGSTTNTPVANAATSTNNNQSIMKFISKMSNKNISICKIESVSQANKPDLNTKSDVQSPKVGKLPIVTSLTAASSSPASSSPKMTPNTNPIAEKRVCSGNGEKAVKRLKLDATEQPNGSSEPGIQVLQVVTTGCKKSLKLAPTTQTVPAVDKTNPTNKENQEILIIDD